MRILTCIFIAAAALSAQTNAPATPQTPAKPAAKKITPLTVPKDAVETEPGFYKWTDKDGKVWTYRRTPFGVARWPADSAPNHDKSSGANGAVAAEPPAGITATDAGDSIRFERATPFGKKTWSRKKSELTPDEKAVWERRQSANPSAGAAEKE